MFCLFLLYIFLLLIKNFRCLFPGGIRLVSSWCLSAWWRRLKIIWLFSISFFYEFINLQITILIWLEFIWAASRVYWVDACNILDFWEFILSYVMLAHFFNFSFFLFFWISGRIWWDWWCIGLGDLFLYFSVWAGG